MTSEMTTDRPKPPATAQILIRNLSNSGDPSKSFTIYGGAFCDVVETAMKAFGSKSKPRRKPST